MNSTNVLRYYSFVGARLAIAVAVLVSAGHNGSAGAQEVASPANPLFLPAVSYHTGGSEAGFVTVADVNGDGFPDLLVANTYYSNTVSVFLGKGDGTFWGVLRMPRVGDIRLPSLRLT